MTNSPRVPVAFEPNEIIEMFDDDDVVVVVDDDDDETETRTRSMIKSEKLKSVPRGVAVPAPIATALIIVIALIGLITAVVVVVVAVVDTLNINVDDDTSIKRQLETFAESDSNRTSAVMLLLLMKPDCVEDELSTSNRIARWEFVTPINLELVMLASMRNMRASSIESLLVIESIETEMDTLSTMMSETFVRTSGVDE